MISGNNDECYNCGNTGHFINECPVVRSNKQNRQKQNQIIAKNQCHYCLRSFKNASGAKYHEIFYCKNKNKNDDDFYEYSNSNSGVSSDSEYDHNPYFIEKFSSSSDESSSSDDDNYQTNRNYYPHYVNNKCYRCDSIGHYKKDF